MARILIVAAHPDDEVIGMGGQMAGCEDLHILHVTDGAPQDMRDAVAYGFSTREAYARARREELLSALALAGIGPERTVELGIADQEASRAMAEIARRLAECIDRLRPALVYTHPYEGGHPDHDATAFAVHAASRFLLGHAPEIREFACYYARGDSLAAYDFLPDAACASTTVALSAEAAARKRRMLDCFVTQRRTLEPFYGSTVEKWRRAPDYDFTAPPNGGNAYYDRFDWGLRSEEWPRLAADALAALSRRSHA